MTQSGAHGDTTFCNKLGTKADMTAVLGTWAVITPHDTTPLLASKELAASLDFQWQWLSNFPGYADHCTARICIVVP
jgi:hypothetical protein